MTIYFFPIHHHWVYEELPLYFTNQLERCKVLFQEGRHGVVFIDPFKTGKALIESNNLSERCWVDFLTEQEKSIAQQVVDRYFKYVKREHANIPKIETIRFWAVEELVIHFDYFMTGDEVDYKIHHKFLDTNKMIIDLDKDCLYKRMLQDLAEEQMRIDNDLKELYRDYGYCSMFKGQLARIDRFFRTNIWADKENCEGLDDFSNIVEQANIFNREAPAIIGGRNCTWIQILYSFFNWYKNRYKTKHLNLGFVCGAGHLPDLFARLMSKGFEVKEVSDLSLARPLSEQTKQMIFGFQLERRAFESIKSSIVSPRIPKKLLDEIAEAEEFKQYVATHGGNKRLAGALILRQ